MAEFGSHHSFSGNIRPSLFEIVAQENLSSSLRSAFRHLFKVFGENYPHKMGPCFRYFDEIYAVIDFFFQYIHMRTYGATFPEHFYGLKRIPNPRQLNVSEKRLLYCLVMSIAFPYIHLQLEKVFKKLREKDMDGTLHRNKNASTNVTLLYLKLFPSIHMLWELIGLSYYMAYAVQKIKFPSPLLHICGMQLVTSDDEPQGNLWEELIIKNYSLSIVWRLVKTCVSSASIGISIGAFFLQFLEWWYDREGAKSSFSPLPLPSPPPQWPTQMASNICPLCQKPRENATALACSGFVFCYPCIFQFVKKNKRCPVTGYTATVEQLIRIYHVDQ